MRIELDDHRSAGELRKLLLNFGQMAVLDEAVGFGAFGAFDEKIILGDLPAGSADAAEGVHHDVLARDEAGAQQRHERHENAGRITAGRGDELRLGFPRRRRQLGQHKARLRQKFGRMVLAVILFVGGEVGDAEVGAEVDDFFAGRHERLGKIGRRPVRERQEKQVDVARGERGGIGIGEDETAVTAADARE